MGLMDIDPAVTAAIEPGTHSAFICGLNPGVDAGGDAPPTDEELAACHDAERYRVILVPGAPQDVGILHDDGDFFGSTD